MNPKKNFEGVNLGVFEAKIGNDNVISNYSLELT